MKALALVLAAVLLAGAAPQQPGDRTEIVGGSVAAPDEFPWMVRLSTGCAGTLISPQHVLTAAHCIRWVRSARSITAQLGSSDLHAGTAIRIRGERVHRAPRYRNVAQGDDWAVIRLSRKVDLPTLDLPRDDRLDHGTFTVVGWGATSEATLRWERHLHKVRVRFVPDKKCAQRYRGGGYNFVSADMICAGDLERGGKDSCQGDSGGPLLRRAGGRWVQVGIVSWGVGCGRAGFPGVYTQLSTFHAEISKVIGDKH